MPTWTVELIGELADLEALAALDGGVVRDGAAFVFRSADLDSLAEAVLVEQAVSQRIEVLKGLLRVMTGDARVRTVTTGGFYREEDGKKSLIILTEPGDFEWRGGIVGDPRAWVAAALRDPEKVGWALQLFAGEPTPATLYKVLEVLHSGEMVRRKWTKPEAIRRFKRTINDMRVLGVQARHGVPQRDAMPAEDAMTVRQLRAFIRDLLAKWLESK